MTTSKLLRTVVAAATALTLFAGLAGGAHAQEAPEALVPEFGTPAGARTITVTALSFEREGLGFSGSRQVKVTVRIDTGTLSRCIGGYKYWEFRLRNAQGVEYQPSAYLAVTRPGALGDGGLACGQFVVGDVYFEVPDDWAAYELHYRPAGFPRPPYSVSRYIGPAA